MKPEDIKKIISAITGNKSNENIFQLFKILENYYNNFLLFIQPKFSISNSISNKLPKMKLMN